LRTNGITNSKNISGTSTTTAIAASPGTATTAAAIDSGITTTSSTNGKKSQFIGEMDLTVGGSVEVWGRTLRLVGCDGKCFTL
jgi:hypothetical protein